MDKRNVKWTTNLCRRNKPCKRTPHTKYLVSWQGMGPEERDLPVRNKLSNPGDPAQDHLQGLQARRRSAPRIGNSTNIV